MPSCCRRWVVTAASIVPGGAYPSYAQGYYPRDNRFYRAWDDIARDRAALHGLDASDTCSACATTPRCCARWGWPRERGDVHAATRS